MKQLKHHLYYLKRVFFEYQSGWYRGWYYLWMRYIVAPRLLRSEKPLSSPANVDHLSMHVLTGRKELMMAVWSLASWYVHAESIGELYIHSDGSLTDADKALCKKLFPHGQVVDTKDFLKEYGEQLTDWPVIKKFREEYVKFQSRKLVDQFVVSDKQLHLLLDTDILWFKRSDELEDAVKNRGRYSWMSLNGHHNRVYVTLKNGEKISDELARYNSGITLYNKDHFDWNRFTEYLESIDYMNTKFTDQACFAYCMLPHLKALSADTYIIKGELTDQIVTRHYTGPSRAKFFLYGIDRLTKKLL